MIGFGKEVGKGIGFSLVRDLVKGLELVRVRERIRERDKGEG